MMRVLFVHLSNGLAFFTCRALEMAICSYQKKKRDTTLESLASCGHLLGRRKFVHENSEYRRVTSPEQNTWMK